MANMGNIQSRSTYVSPQTTQRHQQDGVDTGIKVKGTGEAERTAKLSEREQGVHERSKSPKTDAGLDSKYNKAQILKLKAQIDQVAPPDIQARSYHQPTTLKSFFAPLASKKNWQAVGEGMLTGLKGVGKGLFFATNLVRVPLSQTVRLIGAGIVKTGLAKENTLWKSLHTQSESQSLTPYKESGAIFKQADQLEARGKEMKGRIAELDPQIAALEKDLHMGPLALQMAEAGNSRKLIIDRAAREHKAPNPTELATIDRTIAQLKPGLADLQTKIDTLRTERQTTQEKLTETTQTVSDLRAVATRIRAGDSLEKALYVASYVRTAGGSTNFIALSSEAARQGHSLDAVISRVQVATTGNGDPMISASSLGALGIAGGAFAVGSEAYDMYKTGARLKEGLDRREQVHLVLEFNKLDKGAQRKDLDHDKSQLMLMRSAHKSERAKLGTEIAKLDTEIQAAAGNPKAIDKLNHKRMELFVEQGELHFKETQLMRTIDMKEKLHTQGLSAKTEAVLAQIDNRVDGKFKLAKMVRNVIGMASGSAAVAVGLVAVGAITVAAALTPVGWALAGAALVGTVGFGIASLVKQAGRASKVAQAEANQQHIDTKRTELTKTGQDLERNLSEAQTKLATLTPDQADSLNRAQTEHRLICAQLVQIRAGGDASMALGDLSSGRQADAVRLMGDGDQAGVKKLFEAQLLDDRDQAAGNLLSVERELGVNIDEIKAAQQQNKDDLKLLDQYQGRNQLQLLAADPKSAKRELLDGIDRRDPEMVFIAENVLKLNFSSAEVSSRIMSERLEDAFSMDPGR